ncbi:MAG: hypothetical protein PVG66_02150 [Chromatiales bacterium]|jgi:hypothetical protein
MNKKLATTIILLLALVGATYLAFIQLFTVAYPLVPEDIRDMIVQRLDSEVIWYQESNGVVRVIKGNEQKIIEFGRSASEEIIPMNRSFSPAPGFLEETEAKLRKKGIEYELHNMDGLTWIVLEKKYEGRVGEIWLEGI